MTSAKFQKLGISERHEALSAMTIDQLIEFTETFAPLAGLPVGAESCWRTLALRLAIELRQERAKHDQAPCDCCTAEPSCTVCGDTRVVEHIFRGRATVEPCPQCANRQADPDVMTRELEGMGPADVAMARAAGGFRA